MVKDSDISPSIMRSQIRRTSKLILGKGLMNPNLCEMPELLIIMADTNNSLI
jgi:hypothetical protein